MRTHVILLIVFLSFLYPACSQNPTDSFTDSRDGKVYKTVKIGDQRWMAENLAWLPAVSPSSAGTLTDPYYYVYDYEGTDVTAAKATSNFATFGVLYNWPAALTACPSGWHLPGDAEWKQLEMALGMTQALADERGWRGTDQGTQMKTTSGWYNNYNGTNSSGFSALPGGYLNISGVFLGIGYDGAWLSSTESTTVHAWYRTLNYATTYVGRDDYGAKVGGFSVRCLRDL